MKVRIFIIVIVACLATLPAIVSAAEGVRITGRILDTQGGLPVPNATIELDLDGKIVATTETGPNGEFKFASEPPGTYVVLIRATGYQNARLAPDLIVAAGSAEVSFQAALARAPQGLKTIGYVTTAGTAALQTTATINTHVDAAVIQSYDYQRLADALTAVPGVITSTSSSVGDDMSVSIRGFDPTETSTLLDGHPIGPVGAFGNGYNYNVSPFWGLTGSTVVFGSGASGLFGATTIAGAVDFQSINPTRENHFSVTQGVGTNDKLMTGFLGTGTVGNLGYAFAWGSQGTTGAFPGGNITQNALLQSSVVHAGFQGNAPPPDLTAKNVNNTLNTYWVTGQYSQKNFVGKLKYQFTPKTLLQLTAYSATDWSNSTGNGDNDYQTWPYVLFGAQQTIAGFPKGVDTILVGGKRQSCHNTIAVLVSTPPGYTCMTAPQYATAFYGPFGGSVDRTRWLGNQDYDARLQQGLGAGTITLEGFWDAYNYNAQKGPAVPLGQYTTVGPGPYFLNQYHNYGYLISDDFSLSKHDVGFGYSWLHQANTNGQFPYSFPNGNTYNGFGNNPPLFLATSSYFVRDTWTPSYKLQVFANLWLQRSLDTSSTHFDPRVSVVYRPTTADVVRATYGRSYSEPDPSLIAFSPPVYGAPSSTNCPPATNGSASLTSIASVADPNLVPETANDMELAYGHRFNPFTSIQADVYQTWENQALLSGLVPITSIHQVTVPQNLIDQYIAKLAKCPGLNPSVNSLAFSTTYNASGARYRGIVLSTNVGVARNVVFNASYTIQSASYVGVPQDILLDNTGLIDGGQIYGIPLRQGTMGLSYQNRTGFAARMDANYIGTYNSFNRNPFWWANASVSQTEGQTTVSLGANNLFNSAASQWGLIGYGVYQPQNYYGSAAQGGATNAIAQGSEEYSLPFRAVWLTVKVGI